MRPLWATGVADPLTGETWEERLAQTVHLDGASIVHLRHEIRGGLHLG